MAVNLVIALAIALAGLGVLLFLSSMLGRKPGGTAGPSGNRVVSGETPGAARPAPTAAAPVLDSPEVQMNRRGFFNRSLLLATSVFGVGMAGGSLAFLWPNKISGFGGRIPAGTPEELLSIIEQTKKPYYNPEGRFYIVKYDTSDESNRYVQEGVATAGLMAMYQKCAHLGCRVPFCETSQWFECPCHGSKYNNAGEVQPGSPAPAGLWRFKVSIENGQLVVDTSKPTAQPEGGVDTLNQPPAGPHCTSNAEGAGH